MAFPGFRQGGGDCCCSDCVECNDTFTRADGTDVDTGSPCGWTEVAGNWSIASNELSIASTSAILQGTDVADGDGRISVYAEGKVSSASDRLRVIINYVDANNFYCAEWRCNALSGSFLLIRRAAGVETTLATIAKNVTVGTPAGITLCIRPGWIIASIQTAGALLLTISSNISPSITPTAKWGIGTGTTLAGTASFQRVQVLKYEDGETNCNECTKCGEQCNDGREATSQYLIPVYGLGPKATGIACASCSSAEGDYIASYVGLSAGITDCHWRYTQTFSNPAKVTRIDLYKLSAGLVWELEVTTTCTVGGAPRNTQIRWRKVFASGPNDCDEVTLDYRDTLYGTTDSACELITTGPITITAIP